MKPDLHRFCRDVGNNLCAEYLNSAQFRLIRDGKRTVTVTLYLSSNVRRAIVPMNESPQAIAVGWGFFLLVACKYFSK